MIVSDLDPIAQEIDQAVTRALGTSSSPNTPPAKWARRWLYRIDRLAESAERVADLHTPLGLAATAALHWARAMRTSGPDREQLLDEARRLAVLSVT